MHSNLETGGAEMLRYTTARELHRRGIPFEIVVLEQPGALGELLQKKGVSVHVLGTGNSIFRPQTTFMLARSLRGRRQT